MLPVTEMNFDMCLLLRLLIGTFEDSGRLKNLADMTVFLSSKPGISMLEEIMFDIASSAAFKLVIGSTRRASAKSGSNFSRSAKSTIIALLS